MSSTFFMTTCWAISMSLDMLHVSLIAVMGSAQLQCMRHVVARKALSAHCVRGPGMFLPAFKVKCGQSTHSWEYHVHRTHPRTQGAHAGRGAALHPALLRQ